MTTTSQLVRMAPDSAVGPPCHTVVDLSRLRVPGNTLVAGSFA
ncbi:hypothetical protein [Streptomyces sp. MUSC 14]|nr:hypothetical protein [Streptomyces sp. MUSC 14]